MNSTLPVYRSMTDLFMQITFILVIVLTVHANPNMSPEHAAGLATTFTGREIAPEDQPLVLPETRWGVPIRKAGNPLRVGIQSNGITTLLGTDSNPLYKVFDSVDDAADFLASYPIEPYSSLVIHSLPEEENKNTHRAHLLVQAVTRQKKPVFWSIAPLGR